MGTFHMIYGTLLIVLAIVVTVMEIARKTGVPRALRGITIGLMDLQIILGIITWIVVKPHASFIAHPVFMVIAVILLHIFTTAKRNRSTRVTIWIIADILFILGAALFHG